MSWNGCKTHRGAAVAEPGVVLRDVQHLQLLRQLALGGLRLPSTRRCHQLNPVRIYSCLHAKHARDRNMQASLPVYEAAIRRHAVESGKQLLLKVTTLVHNLRMSKAQSSCRLDLEVQQSGAHHAGVGHGKRDRLKLHDGGGDRGKRRLRRPRILAPVVRAPRPAHPALLVWLPLRRHVEALRNHSSALG